MSRRAIPLLLFLLLLFGCSQEDVGYVAGYNGLLATINYDPNCSIAVGPGTAVRVLGDRPKPQGWTVEAKSIVVLDGPFAGVHGYIAAPFIDSKRKATAFDFSDRTAGVSPCAIGYRLNVEKIEQAKKLILSGRAVGDAATAAP